MIQTPNSTIRNRTNIPAIRKRLEQATTETVDRDALMPPPRRGFSIIPNEDVLQGLIARALAALKQGILWDRGSILNILT